ncbi:MAG: D-TA family PLP-dependent enzyme [Acidobacteriaceae bacterium]|nr:D-TA family PLP-dependent enzyme [Acidobacteriaceae bacterium]
MDFCLSGYTLRDASSIITPALLIYPDVVDSNIQATLRMVDNDANRWRPHIKTAKLAAVVRRFVDHGIVNFKCATTLELQTACEAGARDVLVAFAMAGANARRILELAHEFPAVRISVLVESQRQADAWRDSGIGIFIDVNPGMNRTGISQESAGDVVSLARTIGRAFRGLHYYDGHISSPSLEERQRAAHAGYDQLMRVVQSLKTAGLACEEVITSGTPAAPFGYSYEAFTRGGFIHRISPGTVVYNDFTSLEQLPGYGFAPAALVLSTVISHPLPDVITCDAGHKSVSADAGVPTCMVAGRPGLTPLKPSEEHLPIRAADPAALPAIGESLYLLPRHVCPTVNNFDEALMIVNGEIREVEAVTARGHERPVPAYHAVA